MIATNRTKDSLSPRSHSTSNPKANKTDAGNGSNGICRVIDASRSPSPDPKRSPQEPSPWSPPFSMRLAYFKSISILALPILIGALLSTSALAADIYSMWSNGRPPILRFFGPQLATITHGRFSQFEVTFPGIRHWVPAFSASAGAALLLSAIVLFAFRRSIRPCHRLRWASVIQACCFGAALLSCRPLALASIRQAGPQALHQEP